MTNYKYWVGHLANLIIDAFSSARTSSIGFVCMYVTHTNEKSLTYIIAGTFSGPGAGTTKYLISEVSKPGFKNSKLAK